MGCPKLLTRAELAAVLRVSTKTLKRWREAGRILAPLPGPGLRWRVDEVEAWVKAGRPRSADWAGERVRLGFGRRG
jgi:excisionase family DNA binding protein